MPRRSRSMSGISSRTSSTASPCRRARAASPTSSAAPATVADDAVGHLRAILERKGLLENTTIVIYGDHGDDPWTHGFRGGLTHGTEPYTDIIWTPLAIRDPGLAPATVDRLASTIDIAPTCLALLGVEAKLPFPHSGIDLFAARPNSRIRRISPPTSRTIREPAIAKAFSITDADHTLLASSRGLELYAHRLDPGNHCNLLHLFETRHDRTTGARAPARRRRALQGRMAGQSDVGRGARQRLPAPQSAPLRLACTRSGPTSSSVASPLSMRSTPRASKRSTAKAATCSTAKLRRPAPLPQRCPRSTFPSSCGEGHGSARPRQHARRGVCATQSRRASSPAMRYLILAAGMGKRMGSAGLTPPKCLIDIGGEPLIGRLLRQIRTHDADADIHVVLGYRAEAIAPVLRGCRDRRQSLLRYHRNQRVAVVRAFIVRPAADDHSRRRRARRRPGGEPDRGRARIADRVRQLRPRSEGDQRRCIGRKNRRDSASISTASPARMPAS